MKEYKDYNNHRIQWMGNIPSHWKSLGLKRTINLINEKTTDESLTYIGLENIESFTGRLSNSKFVTPDSTCNLFEIGDILFNKLRPYLTKSFIANFKGKCTTELLVLRGFKGDTKYLNYVLLSPEYIGYIDSSTYGSKMPRANWNFIGNVNIPIPPLSEQQHIVSFLDKKTAKIDEYIDKKNKEIEALKEWKKALIAHVVTKGLNTNAKMKDSGISWIGEIPEHWELRRAKYMFKKHKRPVRDTDEVITCFRDGEVTLRKNRRTTGFTESLTEVGYQGIRKGDLVIHQMDAFAGAIGISDSDGKGTSVYHCCTPVGNFYTRFYLYVIRQMAYSGFIQSLYRGIRERSSDFNYQVFGNQFLYIPPIEEQQEIVEYIDAATTKADKMIVELTNHVESMKEYKQRLIADVVTGKINVQP